MSKIPSTFLKFRLHLLLFLTLSLPSPVISQDQTTLLNVKHQLGDPPSLRSWNSSSPPCTWPEIRCSGGAVTELHLAGKNITAYFPAAICDLARLVQLNISNNNIVGEFPTFLSNCSNLKLLDLSQNYLTGKIPNDIAKLKTLTYLDLGGNGFTGDIPAAIGALSELRTLLLYRNDFNGTFPKEVGNLTNLEVLGLAYNSFVNQTTPFEFGNLKNLKTMWLPMCNLIGAIPETFANLTGLELLDVSFNRLTGNIPSGLFALRNLQLLFLYRNGLSGEIPVLPGSVRGFNLSQVDLSMNNLTGSIPEGFGMLENLTVLHLFSNQLTGQIPRSLGLTPTLKDFKVFGNKLNGTLPPELGLYSKLEYLEFGDNQLSGGFPQHLCDGGALKGLIAFSNNLSGELPQWMGNCSSLKSVQLYNNNFSGEVPFGLWGLNNLTTLMLSNNSFSSQLPSELAWNLSRLEIRNNLFLGKISFGISAVNLVVFDARDNMLSGEIPRALTLLSRLNVLMLDGNQLNGELPSEIISWQSLNTLSLSRNKLSGNIPKAICDLPNLVYLDLAENNISGEIPPQLGNLQLVFLNLSSNKLSGSVPYAFNNLAYENSFLNNPDLCAYNPNLNLSSCLTKKSTSPQTGNSSSSSKYLVLILILAIIVVLATTFLVFCTVRIRKNCGKNHCGGDLSISTWKLTSFQRLNFTEINLFSSLIEENLIGCGGFGKVYRVASDRPGEYVAVKKIWNCMNLDERLEREFMAEVEILSTIRHSNVVKLLCCFSSENSKLLVYEYMENQSLDKWLHGRKKVLANGLSSPNKNCLLLKWPTRLRIVVGAAQGLCYMHHECSPCIVHRDVKSSNILMDSEFRASIADFGLARMLVKPGEPHTVSNIAGSLGYIPPECAYSTKINEKADVYSFGVVLLEVVTGKEPYSGGQHTGNLVDWAWQHYREGKCLSNALDEEIREISYVEEMTTVFKLGLVCTSRLPSNRPSMKEILQVLRECCYPSGNGRRRVGIGFDIGLLHGDTTYISSYKDSNKAISENEESCLYSV